MSTSTEENVTFEPPPRPAGLRKSVLVWHGIGLFFIVLFSLTAEALKHPIPEGKFEKSDGTLIDIDKFDPVELGPYPKCHPHHGEIEIVREAGIKEWTPIASVNSSGPFPPGHPENAEFKKMRDEQLKKDNTENMFTWKGLQPSFHLLALAVMCSFLGCRHAVWLFTEKPDDGAPAEQQLLQNEDAYWFPVLGSCVLFGLFIVYKYISSDWVKFFVSCYVVLMCAFAFGANGSQFMELMWKVRGKKLFHAPYLDEDVTTTSLLCTVIGLAMAVWYLQTKNWIINNIFGVSFSVLGIKKVGISTIGVGAIMLVGLFFYDIFWVFGSAPVFGSNVMVTVAKGVDAPIKLMFPRSQNGCGALEFSMLGLGDIVVPGIYVAFLAKWDAVVQGSGKANSGVYLNVTMVAYTLSLITTVGVMLVFNAAQPALLYIVPFVMIASMGLALIRGEFKELWNYKIIDLADEAKKKQTEKGTKKD